MTMTIQPTLKQLPEHGFCFLCGSENPHNVGLHWYVDKEGVVSSEFTLTLAQQGPPGFAHAGLSAAVLDEEKRWNLVNYIRTFQE